MSKIKVIQIAIAASTDDTWTQQCLDDKGRVWEYFNPTSSIPGKWILLDLPDEPVDDNPSELPAGEKGRL